MYNTLLACNNFFERTSEYGDYTIASCVITTIRGTYKVGQYVRIMDSLLNDGVYKITVVEDSSITLDTTLVDEEFSGYIVGLAIPREFITLAEKVEAYSHIGVKSESIPNYSVTFSSTDGVSAYKQDLIPYNKLRQPKYYFLTWVQIYE